MPVIMLYGDAKIVNCCCEKKGEHNSIRICGHSWRNPDSSPVIDTF